MTIDVPLWLLATHFLVGALFVNGVPHAVMGITGRSHQTPFARPPGVGLSSPVVNVLWGFFNFALAIAAMHIGHFGLWGDYPFTPATRGAEFLGALVMALVLARHFGRVRQDLSRRGH